MVLGWRRVMESVGDSWGWITGSKGERHAAETELQTKIASVILDQLLDELGYSEEDIKQRIFSWYKTTVARTLSARIIQNHDDIDRIFIGSQREGIGLEFINDLDILQIYKFVQCVENQQRIHNPADIVFVVDNNFAPPGHTFLWLQQKGNNENNFSFLEHALVDRKGRKYLSAHKFMSKNDDMFSKSEGLVGKSTKYLGRKGPSLVKISNMRNELESIIMKLYNVKDQTMDYVRGFPCEVKGQIVAWQHRKRSHDWPSTNVVDTVASLTAVVVPTGQKGTKLRELQWRICFPAGELALFNSISNTHKKIYVVLKTVGKLLLRPIDHQITSYVMKNILFWEAEKRPSKDFTDKSIMLCIQDALRYLKNCICKNFLPYYMIPERNLLSCEIPPDIKETLTNVIKYLIANGSSVVLEQTECNKQNKNKQLKEFIQRTQIAQEATKAQIFVESKMSTEEYVDYMVEMFFKETSDSYSTQFIRFLTEKIPNLVQYTFLGLTSIQTGFSEDILLMEQTLKQHNIETCEFPPHYFLHDSAQIKRQDADERAESTFNNSEISANKDQSKNDRNDKKLPVSEKSIDCPDDRSDECHLASLKESCKTVLQQQKPNKRQKTETDKKGTTDIPLDTSIPVQEQTKLLREEVNTKKKQVDENKKSFLKETFFKNHQVTENKSGHNKQKTSQSKEYHLDNELGKSVSSAKHSGRHNAGNSHLRRRERIQNKRIEYPTDQYYDWIDALLTLLDFVLLLVIYNSEFFEIHLILSNNINYLKDVFKYFFIALISVSSVNTLDCVNKCLNKIQKHTEVTVIRKRPPRTWKKLQQLCKQ